MLNPENLYRINKSNQELIQLLSPEIIPANIELFHRISQNQATFNNVLRNKGIGPLSDKEYPELDDRLKKVENLLSKLYDDHKNIKKSKLDLDVAKIFHENLLLPRKAIIDYDFWRYITLFHFIEYVKCRWESNPQDSANWYSNAKAICGRAIGLTLDKKKYDEHKIISYNLRNQRIDSYRYWWIGNKLYDKNRGYYYLDKISDQYKNEDAAVQDFLNHLEGNRLLSENDRISKFLAESLFLSGKKFSEKDMRSCFNRYNAFSNRLLMEADNEMIKKEICLIDL